MIHNLGPGKTAVQIPGVFEAKLCNALVGLIENHGGAPSGVAVRDRSGEGERVLPARKIRRDLLLSDDRVIDIIRARIRSRVLPEISASLSMELSRIEKYALVSYRADEGGHFAPHRDNAINGASHRELALSIGLNSSYVGGGIQFGELGYEITLDTGDALAFPSWLTHAVCPVIRGTRFTFISFLYGEAGVQVRRRERDTTAIESLRYKDDGSDLL